MNSPHHRNITFNFETTDIKVDGKVLMVVKYTPLDNQEAYINSVDFKLTDVEKKIVYQYIIDYFRTVINKYEEEIK
jgi:hypothetical protein